MLQPVMMGDDLAWYFNNDVDYAGENKNTFQFTHTFYKDSQQNSRYFQILEHILYKIRAVSIWRIKANLLTRTPNIDENEFHVDNGDISLEKLKQWTTSIFYVNSNDGYTKFEDGTKVESIANRMVTFPSDMKHAGTSCTDEKTRIVINFNYFK